ncbi:MAG: PAS domain-containing protein [Methanomassiliicoccus sp.]|nr:PAS domain-containing protein [Methanomassiliicoccus sp.]
MEQANRLRDEAADHLDITTVLTGTTSYIYLVDRKLRIQYASPSAERYLGLKLEGIMGKKFSDLSLSSGEARELEEIVRRAFENESAQKGEATYVTTGRRSFFHYDAVPVRNQNGEVRVVVTAKDATAHRSGEMLGEVLNRVYGAVNSTMSTPDIMKRVIEIAASALDSETVIISIREGDRWTVRFINDSPPNGQTEHTMTDETMHRTFLSPEEVPVAVPDIRQVAWVDQETMAKFNILSILSVPFKVRSDVAWALVFSFSHPRAYSTEEIDFSMKLATVVSLVLENSELYHQELDQRYILQTLLDDVPAVVIAVGGRDLQVKWTNGYADRYRPEGFKGRSIVGLSLETVIRGSQETGMIQMLKNVATTGRPYYASDFVLTGLGPDVMYWYGSVVPLRAEGRDLPDLLIMAVDVTEQRKTRRRAQELSQEVTEERERLQAIMATLPVGVALVDRSGRIAEINAVGVSLWASILPSFSDLKDLDKVQAWSFETGEPLRMDDWGMVKATFEGVVTNNEMVTLKRYDGRDMVMMMSSTPIYDDESHRTIGAVAVGQDLTNQLQVQRELVVSKERAELFIDLLTHDINNLNAASMGYLQLLQAVNELGTKERGWVRGSLQALEESSRLIESIRGLQAIESGREALAIIDLDQVLRKVIADHAPHPSREIDIRFISRGNHCIMASPLVQEVFSNLIDNAIKHSEGTLNIWIGVSSTFETGIEYHRVDVEDDGPGIADRVKENVFSRTWRGRTKGVGKGLGLFLVRRLVESLEGRVWVEDRVPGQPEAGARFVVLLPAAKCRDP